MVMKHYDRRRNIHKIAFFVMALFFNPLFHSIAQKSNFGGWYVYNGNQSFKQKWNWANEFQYRSYDMGIDLQQIVVRTGIGYNLSENNNNILLGYAFVYSENYIPNGVKADNIENRIFQQLISKQNFGRVFIQHRYRLEERFLESGFQVRFRYSLGLNIPLNHKTMEPRTVYLSVSDEIFLIAQASVFDRNRLYGGIGYVINNDLKIEAGVLSQMLSNSYRNQLQISFFNNIPFSK